MGIKSQVILVTSQLVLRKTPKDCKGLTTSQSSELYKSAATFNKECVDESSLYNRAQ